MHGLNMARPLADFKMQSLPASRAYDVTEGRQKTLRRK